MTKASAAPKVKSVVLELIRSLVTPPVDDQLTDTCLGISLVLPELDVLLSHFGDWLQTLAKVNNNNKKKIPKGDLDTNLEILMHLAPHIKRKDWAAECLQQLLQLLPALKQRPEAVAKVLLIAQDLVSQVGGSTYSLTHFLEMVLPLFARLTARTERVELVRFVGRLAETGGDDQLLQQVSQICAGLNAMDRKRIDEPDFELRMHTFLGLRERVKGGDGEKLAAPLSYLELAALVYNCCYFLRHEQDSSLKTNALDTLVVGTQSLGQLAVSDPEAGRKLINKVCLEQIRVGLKARDDLVVCDHLAFLQRLVANTSDATARTKDLAKLLDGGSDVDADFFENIRHVQLHRRGRAMSRLAKLLMENNKFLLAKNLSQLVLPVCTAFLLKETYVKHSQLVEQAIELLGAICHCLPWQQYETYVRQGATLLLVCREYYV